MLFNSALFLLGFLPATLCAYFLIARMGSGKAAQWVLIAASMSFYGYWSIDYLGLLLLSVAINFVLGKQLSVHASPRVLASGLVFNLGVLGYFKYTDFAIDNLNTLLSTSIPLLHLLLPLGISFFTFQKVGYLIDCYRGLVTEHSPRRFLLFVLFFPQLVAGPIVHHAEIIPQLKQHEANPIPRGEQMAQGLFFLLIGLFKKIIIADTIAPYSDLGFSNVAALSFLDAWTAAIAFSLQLYFDFSAYSEMAVGLALLFGIRLPQNFNSPYKATSITDFWRRWHMTLGAFMRAYLYIPLGGNKSGVSVQMGALIVTMLIGGIWHGAAWTFVAWGALHAAYLVIQKLWTRFGCPLSTATATWLTLLGVIVAWVPFRSASITDSFAVFRVMFGFDGFGLPPLYRQLAFDGWITVLPQSVYQGHEILWLLLCLAWCLRTPNTYECWQRITPSIKWAAGFGMIGLTSLLSLGAPTSFMYWSF